MTSIIILLITHTAFLIAGIWIGVKNADSKTISKGKELLIALKKGD
jgi:hypothetical protein